MFRWIWAVVVMFCAGLVPLKFSPDRLQTNLFDLLPKQHTTRLENEAIDAYSERLSRKMAILIGAHSHADARTIADKITPLLEESGLFHVLQARLSSEQLKAVYTSYHPYRYGLLSDTARAAIQSNDQWLVQRLINVIVSPVSSLNSMTIQEDPFLLFQDYLTALPKGNPNIQIVDGYPTVAQQEKFYIMIAAELTASPFDQTLQDKYAKLEQQVDSSVQLQTGQTLEIFGVIRHAIENRKLAQNEMTVIGTGSMLGILFLFLLIFKRSWRLLLILVPIAVGLLFAMGVSLLLFDNIHLISLVFGVSLIGVSIDYAIHYSCANSNLTPYVGGRQTIRRLRPALTLGLITTITGYLTLATTEFPALRQMAVIAGAGLIGAYLTVVLWLPVLLNRETVVRQTVANALNKYVTTLSRLGRAPIWLVAMIIIAILLLIFSGRHSNDDIKMMRADLPHLDQIDVHFKQVLNEYPNSQFILVSADSEQQLLTAESVILQELRNRKTLTGRFEGLSDWLPSQVQQIDNHTLLTEHVANIPALSDQLREVGLPADLLAHYQQLLRVSAIDPLTIDKFLNTPFGNLKSDIWLGRIDDRYYSIITMHGVEDPTPVKTALSDMKDALFVDRLATVSDTFRYYRTAIEKIFPYVILVIFMLLILRYGANAAFRIVSAPVIAALTSFMLVQWLLGQYNLFTIFGLIITIAISIDYAIFVRESGGHENSTYLAITLAGMTTILAFGLLALSKTPALYTFGLTLLLGVIISYLITPLVVMPGRKRQ